MFWPAALCSASCLPQIPVEMVTSELMFCRLPSNYHDKHLTFMHSTMGRILICTCAFGLIVSCACIGLPRCVLFRSSFMDACTGTTVILNALGSLLNTELYAIGPTMDTSFECRQHSIMLNIFVLSCVPQVRAALTWLSMCTALRKPFISKYLDKILDVSAIRKQLPHFLLMSWKHCWWMPLASLMEATAVLVLGSQLVWKRTRNWVNQSLCSENLLLYLSYITLLLLPHPLWLVVYSFFYHILPFRK